MNWWLRTFWVFIFVKTTRSDFWACSPGLMLWTPEDVFAAAFFYSGAFVVHAGAVYSAVWQMEVYSYSWDKNPF